MECEGAQACQPLSVWKMRRHVSYLQCEGAHTCQLLSVCRRRAQMCTPHAHTRTTTRRMYARTQPLQPPEPPPPSPSRCPFPPAPPLHTPFAIRSSPADLARYGNKASHIWRRGLPCMAARPPMHGIELEALPPAVSRGRRHVLHPPLPRLHARPEPLVFELGLPLLVHLGGGPRLGHEGTMRVQ